ncbi:hypothetical protein [Methylocella tundrae]|nr:hypothetical protein [Methylocella tundrae]
MWGRHRRLSSFGESKAVDGLIHYFAPGLAHLQHMAKVGAAL